MQPINDPNAEFEYATTTNGSQIIYEIGVKMFDFYGGLIAQPTVVRQLEPGMIVGFDIVAATRYESGPYGDGFGMRSENLMLGKFENAGQFQKYTLGGANCGPWGYFIADIDRNCTVDLGDFAIVAADWLYCTDPDDPLCDTSWMTE